MRVANMSHDGKKHIEWQLGKFFVAYNEFVSGFGFSQPPQTAAVHIMRVGRWAFGWW